MSHAARLAQASALLAEGRRDEAREALLRLAAGAPRDTAALALLARACALTGQFEQGAFHARRALAVDPACRPATDALMMALIGAGKPAQAVEAADAALALAPTDEALLLARCGALQAAGRCRDAIEGARAGLARHPERPGFAARLAGALGDVGRADEAFAILDQAWRNSPDDHTLAADACAIVVYASRAPAEARRAAFRRYGEMLERLAPSREPRHTNTPDPGRRIRVGFLSPDLRAHPVGRFIEPVLEGLSRERFEIVVYSTAAREDDLSARLRALPLTWKHTPTPDPNALSRAIFADRVDVLIELSGHSAGHALPSLHVRPAPVQVTYLGFPSTTGVRALGWRITDSLADPPGADAEYTERLARLAPCFLCYTAPPEAADARTPRESSDGARPFTFGSFNSISKLNDDVLRVWARILVDAPGSRLLLKHIALTHEQGRDILAERFEGAGVPRDRLDLRGPSPFAELLATYNEVDVALDPFPFNGATTTCDALAMGVPVVTLAGAPGAGRVGLSILTGAGLPELVARDEDEYVRLASAFASPEGRARLEALRRALPDRFRASPVCDGPSFAGRFGDALERMWREYCAAHAR